MDDSVVLYLRYDDVMIIMKCENWSANVWIHSAIICVSLFIIDTRKSFCLKHYIYIQCMYMYNYKYNV